MVFVWKRKSPSDLARLASSRVVGIIGWHIVLWRFVYDRSERWARLGGGCEQSVKARVCLHWLSMALFPWVVVYCILASPAMETMASRLSMMVFVNKGRDVAAAVTSHTECSMARVQKTVIRAFRSRAAPSS